MERSTPVASIAKIQSVLEKWRSMGSRVLPNGTELLGQIPDPRQERWLHTIYPGLAVAELNALEHRLSAPLSRDLRTFYRRMAGLSLWTGAFRVFGYNPAFSGQVETNRYPTDALRLNHELDVLGWKPAGSFAFAENAWDMSVHLVGVTEDPRIVHRCDRASGDVIETHSCVWRCVVDRLMKIDQLMTTCEVPTPR